MIKTVTFDRRQKRLYAGAIVALVVVTLLAYWPAVSAKFIWDDDIWIQNNPLLRSADGLRRIWTDPLDNPEYYPLTLSNFWLDYQLWGVHPLGYHLVNILMHAGNAVLMGVLLSKLRVPGAWLAAVVFALHPVNVESVAWATERKNTLSALLALLSVLTFVQACGLNGASDETAERPGDARRRWWALTGSILLYAGAVLAKTVLIMLPGTLLVIVWWRRGRLRWRDAARVLPYVLIGLPLGVFAVWMQTNHTGATGVEFALTPLQRLLIAGRVPWFYLSKLVWPSPLIFVYPKWQIDPSVARPYAWPMLTVALLVLLVATCRRISRGPLAAVLIFGGMLSPALGFFNIYWHRYTYVADHVQYHASIAIIALFAATVTIAARRWLTPATVAAPATLLLIVLGTLTWRQARLYADNEPLLRDTIIYNPGSTLAHENLAETLAGKGRIDEAIAEFRISLDLAPRTPERLSKAQYNLATTLESNGELAEAERLYQAAIATSPAYVSPRYNLANLLLRGRRFDEAIAQYKDVIRLEPDRADARCNLGSALLMVGRPAEAVEQFRAAAQLNPTLAAAKIGLQRAMEER